MKHKVLVAEDYEDTRDRIAHGLGEAGFEVVKANNGSEALEIVCSGTVDIVVSDYKMGGLDGLTLYERIRELGLWMPFVLYSSSAPSEVPFQAGREGVLRFLDYPFDIAAQLVPTVRQSLTRAAGQSDAPVGAAGLLIGSSAELQQIRNEIRRYAPTSASVLVSGETGTGKELVARSIHAASKRASDPFLKVNCPALPGTLVETELFGHEKGAFTGAMKRKRGKFEVASGGTIFLDEIGEVELQTQAKLLQVLQDGCFERL